MATIINLSLWVIIIVIVNMLCYNRYQVWRYTLTSCMGAINGSEACLSSSHHSWLYITSCGSSQDSIPCWLRGWTGFIFFTMAHRVHQLGLFIRYMYLLLSYSLKRQLTLSSCVGNLIQPIRSTTQIWVVTRHQYGISALLGRVVRSWIKITQG